jgi:tripartite ATP-independent transporter DctP family solute receptor
MKYLSFLLVLVSVSAQAKTVKFATVAPDGTPWADSLKQIQTRVKKDSGGKIKIKTYLGGQLGGELEILQGIRRGRIQGGGLTSAALASVIPEMDVLEIPYLFESNKEADYILDKHLLEPFRKIFEKKGLILVSWAENGWRNIGTKSKAINGPDDLKGLKVRSQESKTHLAFWKRMKSKPVAIPVPEVLSALQTGVVEGFDNTPLFTLAAEWHSTIKHYTVTRHIYQPAAVVYSARFWKKLNAEEKKILMGDGNALAPGARAGVRALEDELLGVLKEMGIKVVKPSSSQLKAFRERVKGIDEEIVSKLGKAAKNVYSLIKKGQEEFR